jgi:hypothetical protein
MAKFLTEQMSTQRLRFPQIFKQLENTKPRSAQVEGMKKYSKSLDRIMSGVSSSLATVIINFKQGINDNGNNNFMDFQNNFTSRS